MPSEGSVDLDGVVTTVCRALDNVLKHAGIVNDKGRLMHRHGPFPEVDDREIFCLCLLQEWLVFKSGFSFYEGPESNQVMCDFFPRGLSWQKWAARNTLLTPLLEHRTSVFSGMVGDDDDQARLFHPRLRRTPRQDRKSVFEGKTIQP